MRNILLRLFSKQRYFKAVIPRYRTMSSGSGGDAAALYTMTVGAPTALGAVPDTMSEKSHWLRDETGKGEVKGFVNPWESSHDFTFPEIFKAMVQ